MINNYKELSFEVEMLRGCINRICVTDEVEELERMYMYAKIRLDEIYSYNNLKLKKKEDE